MLVIGNVIDNVGIAGENNGDLVILTETQDLEIVGSRVHFMPCRHQTAGIDFEQGMILFGSKHDRLEQKLSRAIARVGDDMSPGIADGGNHSLSVLLRRAPLPTEFMDACDAKVQTMLVVVLVEIERTLGVEDIQLGSQKEAQPIDHTGHDMEIAEMDGIACAWDTGTMLSDTQDLQSLLLGSRDHL